MKRSVGVAACAAILAIAGCGRPPDSPSSKKNAPFVPAAFNPPADSVISRPMMRAWFACNRGLDSLSKRFPASLSEGGRDSAGRLFTTAQDVICAENGLAGGYAEYRWILENLGREKNRPLYDSIRAALPP
jgi:hypothetical protein